MIHTQDADFTLYQGDVLDCLRELGDGSVHCVVTSPPYFALRDYQVEGQIGLEPTLELYVARMVEVFREVKRVLRDDGTLWLNLGDSYASSPKGNPDALSPGLTNMGRNAQRANSHRTQSTIVGDLKPKDLCGIPWSVAKALQAPYYTGKIAAERDRIWLAAMVDAEGCIYVHKRKAGAANGQGYERKNDTYGSGMEISNTSREIIERIVSITGRGSISEASMDARRRQPLYRWNLRTNECRDVLREVYPHLVAKQQQARLAIGCPSSGKDAEATHESLKALHNGRPATIDFPAPESLFEPGWYLRSDVIWGKPNPMPESVTDRPTKAHEYVFLLSKQPRYYYDAEAIREPHSDKAGPVERFGNVGAAGGQKGQIQPDAFTRVDFPRRPGGREYNPAGRNVRSVWEIATQPYPDAHFATYPEELVRRCILAGTSERGCCPACGAPWERETETSCEKSPVHGAGSVVGRHYETGANNFDGAGMPRLNKRVETLGWRPGCDCGFAHAEAQTALQPIPCVVLDPFAGSGTTNYVARQHGRHSIGIELNPDYCALAARRMQQQSLFAMLP